jgi:hypothetical protein
MGIEAALIGGGLGLIGSSMAGRSAERAASTSAAAQERAAQLAAEEARFRPVGITSRFGQSAFQFGPEGRLTGASYTASPEIQALQDRLSALYGDSLGLAEMAPETARGLFNLGTGYLSESPEAARQRIFNQLQAVREPAQMREEARLGAGVFGRGRAGLNISGMGQPELFSLARAREEQRMQDVLAAEQQAQQQIGFGQGLLSSAYQLPVQALAPFQTQFGTAQQLEAAAQDPLNLGAQLGGRAAQGGATAASALLSGGQNAANLRMQGSLVGPTLQANALADLARNPQIQQGIGGLFGRAQQAMSPMMYGSGNVYGPFGSGTVPVLSANPAFGSAEYFAYDI